MTKSTTLLPGVSLTLLLSAGCAVGPNYKRPSVDVPGTYRGRTPQDVAQPAPESLGDLERWEVFHDEQLLDLIHTGLQQNYDVRVAATRILEAQAHVGITRTDQLTPLSGGAQAVNSALPTQSFSINTPRMQTKGRSRWPGTFIFGEGIATSNWNSLTFERMSLCLWSRAIKACGAVG
jgi:outer membrane protein TolC